jgi:hypothetical protein
MVRNLVRKGGVPALALSSTDSPTPWPCSLTLLDDEEKNAFSVLLEAPITIHGIEVDQTFVLRFDGDNLKSGKMAIKYLNTPVTDASVKYMTREGQPRLRMLMLTLKAPCAVWYPRTLVNQVSCLCTPSREIVDLAKTTEVHIVFDTLWLAQKTRFRSIVQTSSQFSGVLVDPHSVYSRKHLQGNWQILRYVADARSDVACSIEDATTGATSLEEHAVEDAKPGFYDSVDNATLDVLPSIEVNEAEAEAIKKYGVPPAYPHLPSKRIRASKSSRHTQHRLVVDAHCPAIVPGECPEAKRPFQDPTLPSLHGKRATSATSTAWSDATVEVDVFGNTVKSAVRDCLPDVLQAVIPGMLQKHLMALLASSPSRSPTPPYHKSNMVAKHHSISSRKLTPAAVFRDAVSARIKSHLDQIITTSHERAREQAEDIASQVYAEVGEILEEHRVDMALVAQQKEHDFHEKCNEELIDLKARIEEEVECAEDEVAERVETVREGAMVDVVRWMCRCKCKCLHNQRGRQPLRATSLPLFDRATEPTADTKRAQLPTDDGSSTEDEL